MKQYVIDELRMNDYIKIKNYVDKNFQKSSIKEIYWIKLKTSILSDIQKQHKTCAPFYIAVELGEKKICCELLIRSMNRIRCECVNYANIKQINWIIYTIDKIMTQLKIIT